MARKQNESFEDYKVRRAASNTVRKETLKGKVFWPSKSAGIFLYPEGRPKRKQRDELVTRFKEELTNKNI